MQVWSTGGTASAWAADLRAVLQQRYGRGGGGAAVPRVEAVCWKPGDAAPVAADTVAGGAGAPGGLAAGGAPPPPLPPPRPVRLFAFGMEKTRARVRAEVLDWDDELDAFVA